MRTIASQTSCLFTCCLVKTLQIPVFLAGLLWELQVVKIKQTPIHFEPLVEKTSQKKTVFLHIR